MKNSSLTNDSSYPNFEVQRNIQTVLLSICAIGSILLNGLIVLVYMRYRKHLSSYQRLLISMSINELINVFCCTPLSIFSSAKGYWYFGEIGCMWYGLSGSVGGLGSIYHLSSLSIERFISIKYSNITINASKRINMLSIIVSWLLPLTIGVLPLAGISSYRLEGLNASCAPNWNERRPGHRLLLPVYFGLGFAVPFCILLVTCSMAWIEIRRMTVRAKYLLGKNSTMVFRSKLSQRNMFITVTAMVGAFLLSWGPYASSAMQSMVRAEFYIPVNLLSLQLLAAKSFTLSNPLVFCILNKEFRKHCTIHRIPSHVEYAT